MFQYAAPRLSVPDWFQGLLTEQGLYRGLLKEPDSLLVLQKEPDSHLVLCSVQGMSPELILLLIRNRPIRFHRNLSHRFLYRFRLHCPSHRFRHRPVWTPTG